MTPSTSHPGLGRPVLPPLVARVARDAVLILGLGLAVALLRSAAAGADPGGVTLPAAPERPAAVVERAEARPTPALLGGLLAPVRDLVAPAASGAPTPAPAPSRGAPAPARVPDDPPSPAAAAPASAPPPRPIPSPTVEAPAPVGLEELLAPVSELLDAVTAPLVPALTVVLEPLRPVLAPVAPTLLPDVVDVVSPPTTPPVLPEIDEPALRASFAQVVPLSVPPHRPGPVSAADADPGFISSTDPPVPASARPAEQRTGPGLAPPTDGAPASPVDGALGSLPPSTSPTSPVTAVLPLIETPAVVAAGLVVPSSTDGTSITSPRPGFSPD